jgi:hypothetical protein
MGECKNEWSGEETNDKKKRRQQRRDVRDNRTLKAALKNFIVLYG